ncbi:MAG TPA: argininosuccinate lyase [bacterium]|nr:argininosuccinate lyase [bacterium]
MSQRKTQIWGGHLAAPPDELMVRFCAGRDVMPLPMADAELLPFDLWTNRAHAIMLQRQGIIEADTLKAMLEALRALEQEWMAGRFTLDPALEDVHVNVERYVSLRAGADVGGRLHTGRSRNDQVTCDMRLFLRGAVLELGESVAALADALLHSAKAHAETVMPGFTHHQPAMITTWGHWLSAYAQALCRDLERSRLAFDLVNRSPLGAAASFGTSWPIDRALTAELLAFDRPDGNTLDSITARWEHEAQVAGTYSMVMNHLSVMSQDLMLLSHPYWGMLSLPDRYVTGSSIMPQKRNPDLAEVVRGKTAWLYGMVTGLLAMPKGLMSGYNRDTQVTKYAIMDVVRECQAAPVVLKGLLEGLSVNVERMRERLDEGFIAAADFADVLARTLNLPFRACYDVAAVAVRKSGTAGRITDAAAREALGEAGLDPASAASVLADQGDPARIVAWRNHIGAPAPQAVREQIARLREELTALSAFLPERKASIEGAYARCRDFQV